MKGSSRHPCAALRQERRALARNLSGTAEIQFLSHYETGLFYFCKEQKNMAKELDKQYSPQNVEDRTYKFCAITSIFTLR